MLPHSLLILVPTRELCKQATLLARVCFSFRRVLWHATLLQPTVVETSYCWPPSPRTQPIASVA